MLLPWLRRLIARPASKPTQPRSRRRRYRPRIEQLEDRTVLAANVTIAGATAGGSFGLVGLVEVFTPSALVTTATVNAAEIDAFLNARTSVTIETTNGAASAGDITQSAAVAKTGGGDATLTLLAENNVQVSAGSGGISSSSGRLTLVLTTGSGGNAAVADALTTNGGNLTVTSISGTIDVSGIVTTGAGGVTLNAGGAITESGTISGGTLTTTSVGGTTLSPATANQVTVFAATNTGGSDVILKNAAPLIIAGIGQSGGNVMVTNTGGVVVSGAVATTGAGGITLTAGGAGSDLLVNAAITSDTGAINATAGRAISEGVGGTFGTAGLLMTSSTAGQTLGRANTVGSFHAGNTASNDVFLTNTTATLTVTGVSESVGLISVSNTGALMTTGTVSTTGNGSITLAATATETISAMVAAAGGGTVTLTASGAASDLMVNAPVRSGTGPINATAGRAISEGVTGTFTTAGQLTTLSAADQMLARANAVAGFSATTSGNVMLVDGTTALTVGAVSTGGGALSINDTTDAVVVTGAVSAGSGDVTLMAHGTVKESGMGAIVGGTLTVTSMGGITLKGGNMVSGFVATDTGGDVTLQDSAATLTLGTVTTGGGDLSVTNSTGGIGQSALATITCGTLTTSSVGGTNLGNANHVNGFAATNTTGGDVTLTDGVAALTVTGVGQTGGGNVVVRNTTGTLTVSGAITAAGGGSISLRAATLVVSPAVPVNAGGDVNLTADSITLNGPVTAGASATVRFQPSTAPAVDLGGAGGPGVLGLSGATINAVSGGTIEIDSPTTFTVSAAINAGGHNLSLMAQSGVMLTGAAVLTNVGRYTVSAGTGAYSQAAAGNTVAATGDVSITAASVTLADTLTSGGNITLQPSDPTQTVGIAGGAGTFSVPATAFGELLSSGTVTIGAGGGSGTVNVGDLDLTGTGFNLTIRGGDINVNNLTVAAGKTLELLSGGAINQTGGTTLTEQNLVLVAANGIGSAVIHLAAAANNLDAATTAGGIFVNNTGSLTVEDLNGDGFGLAGGTDDIVLSSTGALALSAPVGGPTFAATITLRANTGGAGAGGFAQDPGASISTTNTTAAAVTISVNAAGGGMGGAALRDVTAGAGGTILVNTATNGDTMGGNITRMSGTLMAGAVSLITPAGNGSSIGLAATPIQTKAATVMAATGSGGVFISNAGGASFAATAAGAGNVQLTTTGGGTLAVTGATTTGSGGITLTSADGVTISAAVSGGRITVSAAGAISQTAGGTLTATDLLLVAGSGIGPLTTTVSNLNATTATGGVFVSNTGALFITDLNGDGFGVRGGAGGIGITAHSPLTINSPVVDNVGGDIALTAAGTTTADDLTLDAPVTASGGNGSITLQAGHSIIQNVGGKVSAAGSGAITYTAGTGIASGAITVADTISAGTGAVMLSAPATINLGNITAAGRIAVSAGGAISQTAGTLTATDLLLSAGSGIGPLTTAVSNLDATTATGGVFVTNTGPLTVKDLNLDGFGVHALGGSISLSASGTFTVSDPVTAAGNNDVSLTATGSTSDLFVNAAVSSGSGTITAGAGRAISEGALGAFSTSGLLSATSGAGQALGGPNTVGSFHATAGGGVTLNNTAAPLAVTGVITTAGGISLTNTGSLTVTGPVSANGGGTVGLSAVGASSDLQVNALVGSASGPINVSAAGAIMEGGGSFSTLGLLSSMSGGSQTLGGPNTVASFHATAGGDITLNNTATLLTVTGVTGGNISITNMGSLVVAGPVSAAGAGMVGLAAVGAGSDLSVNAMVSSVSGPINASAGGSIDESGGSFSTLGLLSSTSGSFPYAQLLNGPNSVASFHATAGGSVSLTNTAGTLTVTGITVSGFISVSNTGALTTSGTISTGPNGAVSLTATGAETIGATITAGSGGTLTLSAGGPLTINQAVSGGFTTLNHTGQLILNADVTAVIGFTQNGPGAVVVGGAGTRQVTTVSATTSGANITFVTGVTLNSDLTTTSGGGAIRFQATVDLTSHTLTLNDDGAATINGVISGTTGGITKQGTGTLTLPALSGGSQDTYAGPTRINAGAVVVNGSLANSGVVLDNTAPLGSAARATLAGEGTVKGITATAGGGVLIPGPMNRNLANNGIFKPSTPPRNGVIPTPGLLTSTANVVLNGNVTVKVGLNGSGGGVPGVAVTPGQAPVRPVAGRDYDQLLISAGGSFNAGGATLQAQLGTASFVDDAFAIVKAAGGTTGSGFTPASFTLRGQAFPVKYGGAESSPGSGAVADSGPAPGPNVIIWHRNTAPVIGFQAITRDKTSPLFTFAALNAANQVHQFGGASATLDPTRPNSIVETDIVNLSWAFTDPDELDGHRVGILFGDGVQQVGVPFTGTAPAFAVNLQHRYDFPESAAFIAGVNDFHTGGKATVSQPITVLDAPLRDGTAKLVPQDKAQPSVVTGLLAQFRADAFWKNPANSFLVTVDWRDNTAPSSTADGLGDVSVTPPDAGGLYSVYGTHNYVTGGRFQPTITVTSNGLTPPGTMRPGHSTLPLITSVAYAGNQGTELYLEQLSYRSLNQVLSPDSLALLAARGLTQQQITQAQREAAVEQFVFSQGALQRTVDILSNRFGLGALLDAATRNGYVQFLAHGGTRQQLASIMVASPAYYQTLHHNNPTEWVVAIYHDYLNADIAGASVDASSPAVTGPASQVKSVADYANVADQLIFSDAGNYAEMNFLSVIYLGRQMDKVQEFPHWDMRLQQTSENQVIREYLTSDLVFGYLTSQDARTGQHDVNFSVFPAP